MKLLIKNGRVINPATKTDAVLDILVEDGKITKIEKEIKEKVNQTVQAKNCYVMPGFIDLHVHLRDPGFEYKEDITTGAAAAAKGGFTTILAMPNTKPAVDNPDVVNYVHTKAKNLAHIHVLQIGAITKKQAGEELADIKGMVKAGIPAISEDGKSVLDTALYREAMQIAAEEKIPVFAHCEDMSLVQGGVMNDGKRAKELGLKGIPNAAEDVIEARDLMLAKDTGVKLHLCHCSTAGSVELLEFGKKSGIDVTGETCPHYFTLCDEDIPSDNPNYKMNPPLRSKADKEAVIEGLKNNVLDVIATDHAPHAAYEKGTSMKKAPFGIVGLETAAVLTYSELVKTKILTPMQMAEKLSLNPSKIIGLDKGSLEVGKTADIVVFDPNAETEIDESFFAGKSKNSPFIGRKVSGKVKTSIADGMIVYSSR